jgi:hypothetical protein
MTRLVSVFSLVGLCVANCLANTFSFTGSDTDGSVNASADITLSGNIATVVRHNLESDIGAPGQMISGFGFVVQSGGTTLTGTGLLKTCGTSGTDPCEQGVERTLNTTKDSNGDYGLRLY